MENNSFLLQFVNYNCQAQKQVKEKETPFDGLIVMINGHGEIENGKRCKSKYRRYSVLPFY